MEDEFKPKIGKEFESLEEAWMCWNDYARRAGFGARKYSGTKSRKDGETITYRYVCCKHGLRKQAKDGKYPYKHRAETRTNCKARMVVSRVNQKFKITRLDEEHNHPLDNQETILLSTSPDTVQTQDIIVYRNITVEDQFKPVIGKEFESLQEAWMFWNDYGRRVGFGARKLNGTKSKKNGEIITYRYACCKGGLKKDDKEGCSLRLRSETRTNCMAKMVVSLVNHKYKVTRFDEEHNHPLHIQEARPLIASQTNMSEINACEIDPARSSSEIHANEMDLARKSGLQEKDNFDLMRTLRYGQLLHKMVRLASKASKTLERFERVQKCITELENSISDDDEDDIVEPFENGRRDSRNGDVHTGGAPPSKRRKVNTKEVAKTRSGHPIEPTQTQYALPLSSLP